MTTHDDFKFWYDWVLPFGAWQRAEWPKRNTFGKLVMVLQVPMAAIGSIVFWALALFALITLAPMLWIEEKMNKLAEMTQPHPGPLTKDFQPQFLLDLCGNNLQSLAL